MFSVVIDLLLSFFLPSLLVLFISFFHWYRPIKLTCRLDILIIVFMRIRFTSTGNTGTGERVPVSRGMQVKLPAVQEVYSGRTVMNIKCEGQSDKSTWSAVTQWSVNIHQCIYKSNSKLSKQLNARFFINTNQEVTRSPNST